MTYRVEFLPTAHKMWEKLDPVAKRRVGAALELLATNPHPPGAALLQGWPKGTLRVRTGDYRIVYQVLDDRLVVLVIRIGHRREVYEHK